MSPLAQMKTRAVAVSALAVGAVAPLLWACPAVAQTDAAFDAVSPSDATAKLAPAQSAEEALLLPFTVTPQVAGERVVGKMSAGYDGAVEAFAARGALDARLTDFLALRVDYEQGPGMGPEYRFGVGARAQLLNQRQHGVDGAAAVFWQPNDFREEGHIAGALLVGRYFGRLGLFANALFGGDPEGDDMAAEMRLSTLYRITDSWRVGFDNRFRVNMSEDLKRAGTLTRDWELQSLPSLSYTIGPVAICAQAGLSALQTTGPFGAENEQTRTQLGLLSLAGLGGAF